MPGWTIRPRAARIPTPALNPRLRGGPAAGRRAHASALTIRHQARRRRPGIGSATIATTLGAFVPCGESLTSAGDGVRVSSLTLASVFHFARPALLTIAGGRACEITG